VYIATDDLRKSMFNKNNNKTKYIIIGCLLAVSLGLNAYFFTKTNSDMFPPSNTMDSETITCVYGCKDNCNTGNGENDKKCFYSCASTCIVDTTLASCSNFDASIFDEENIKDAEKDCLCTSKCIKTIGQNPEECTNLCTKENNWDNLFYNYDDRDKEGW